MPSSKKVSKALLNSLGDLDQNLHIVELGAGWGSLLIPIAQKYPSSTITAFENSLIPYLFCRLRLQFSPCKNVRLYRKSFYSVSLQDYDIFICYLYPGAMLRLSEKLKKEMKPSAILLSSTFHLPGYKSSHEYDLDDLYRTRIFQYKSCNFLPSHGKES